jgi:transposase InsO family protein
MCRHLKVTPGGFYAWQGRQPSQRQLDDAALSQRICDIHAASRGIYGSPRVMHSLRQQGHAVGQRRVARLMRGANLQGRSARLYRRSRVSQRAFYKSIPNRQHHIELVRTDQVWVGDVTYLKVRQQWRYLAVVMDKYSRRILGWSLSAQRDAALTTTALNHALRKRRPDAGLFLHTDRGIEYAALNYRAALAQHGVIQSMNRPARMNDNAHMESFFHSLKSEYLYGKQFDTDEQLRQTLLSYLHFYNHSRIHSSLNHVCPAAFEQLRTYQSSVN